MSGSWLCRCILVFSFVSGSAGAQSADEALAAWRDGQAVVLMRHALAPGVGDPTGFDIKDCRTQRNLSDDGRDQARRIGERLQAVLGDHAAEVFSSGWCRCLETGRLLGLGEVNRLPPLDSLFRARDSTEASTQALVDFLDARRDRGAPPAVLVTHQVNITALTGDFASSGGMLIIAPDADAPNGYGVQATIDSPVSQ